MKYHAAMLFAGALGCVALRAPDGHAATEKVLYAFCPGGFPCGSDGAEPVGGVIDVGGTLYGVTGQGGPSTCDNAYICGTVFAVNATTGAEKILYSFSEDAGGWSPGAGLTSVNGNLYGTTLQGGDFYDGVVFSLNPKTGSEKVLWSFDGFYGYDGEEPLADLHLIKGAFFSTTLWGGEYSSGGTLYAVDPKTGAQRMFWSFGNSTDGEYPHAAPIFLRGLLYGTTSAGGKFGAGAVYSFDQKTGQEKVLWSFGGGTDGQLPYAGLISVNGLLYGVTVNGGQYGDGVLFSLDPGTGMEKVLWSFGNGADGRNPVGGLIDVQGALYGATENGGSVGGCMLGAGCGSIFSFDPSTGAEHVLWSFGNGTDGQLPSGGLISVNGAFYGVTVNGGQYGYGTVYSLKP
jgi:uncharacterized repeat protein (TIGR03803 family)